MPKKSAIVVAVEARMANRTARLHELVETRERVVQEIDLLMKAQSDDLDLLSSVHPKPGKKKEARKDGGQTQSP